MFRRAIVLLLSLLAADAAAQTVTLSVSNATARMTNTADFDDYAAGYIAGESGVSYTVTFNPSSNANSQITAVCVSMLIAGTASAGNKGALAKVQWGQTATTLTNVLGTAATEVRKHSLSTASRSASGVIFFRTDLSYSDGPGTYTGPNLTYSVSAANGACAAAK